MCYRARACAAVPSTSDDFGDDVHYGVPGGVEPTPVNVPGG